MRHWEPMSQPVTQGKAIKEPLLAGSWSAALTLLIERKLKKKNEKKIPGINLEFEVTDGLDWTNIFNQTVDLY